MSPTTTTLSAGLRAGTQDVHEQAESSPFMRALFAGELGLEAYVDLLVQLQPVYLELERALVTLEDPDLADVLDPRLARTAAIEYDLVTLAGARRGDPDQVTDAARAYAARIRECVDHWSGGYVAHHWTRYLGDLAGGQAIRALLRRHHDLPTDGGTRFFEFDDLPPAPVYRQQYHAALDALPWDALDREAVVAEAVAAFDHNRAVFYALAARHC